MWIWRSGYDEVAQLPRAVGHDENSEPRPAASMRSVGSSKFARKVFEWQLGCRAAVGISWTGARPQLVAAAGSPADYCG